MVCRMRKCVLSNETPVGQCACISLPIHTHKEFILTIYLYIRGSRDWIFTLLVCQSVLPFIYSEVYFGSVCVTLLSIAWRSPNDNDPMTCWDVDLFVWYWRGGCNERCGAELGVWYWRGGCNERCGAELGVWYWRGGCNERCGAELCLFVWYWRGGCNERCGAELGVCQCCS